eukprot:m.166829 g.166829  ORF g.166829 m.166829 type:complete len:113 (+) comp14710_c0_seq7:34-372(+)
MGRTVPHFTDISHPRSYPIDYADMIRGFKALPSTPAVYALSSPPLYNGNFAGINQTVVNHILPGLVKTIAASADLPPVVPVFEGYMFSTHACGQFWYLLTQAVSHPSAEWVE